MKTPEQLEVELDGDEAGLVSFSVGAGRAKLSKPFQVILPGEIIRLYARLPKTFRKRDVDIILGERISRDMKWRYLRRMEKMGLVNHPTKKQYEKVFDHYSDWLESIFVPSIKSMELTGEKTV
ncbi:MAG: hypothetical protein ACE5KO_03570 [Candidatus Bathyarchaeia archaeon]